MFYLNRTKHVGGNKLEHGEARPNAYTDRGVQRAPSG